MTNTLEFAYILHRHGDCILSIDSASGNYFWQTSPQQGCWFRGDDARSPTDKARQFLFTQTAVKSGLAIEKGCYVVRIDLSETQTSYGKTGTFFSEDFFDALASARNAGLDIVDVLFAGKFGIVVLADGTKIDVNRSDWATDEYADAVYKATNAARKIK